MKSKIFSKVMSVYFKSKEVEGLIIYHDEEYSTIEVGFPLKQEIKVPLLKIKNPKNISFSYPSVLDLLEQEMSFINSLVSTNIPENVLTKLIKFKDFQKTDFYYPDELFTKFKNCLSTGMLELKTRVFENSYTLTGRYVVDSDFDMVWEDSERLDIRISFEIDTLVKTGVATKTQTEITDREEIISTIYNIQYEDSYFFEEPIWNCIVNYIKKDKTFLNDEWQYVSISVIPN